MKKFLKKMIAVFVSVITVIGIMPVIYPETNEKANAYYAEQFDFSEIKKIADNYENIANDIDLGTYLGEYYTSYPVYDRLKIGMNNSTVAPGFIERMQNSVLFNEAYEAWETANFIADPVDGVIRALSKDTFYKTAIIRLLNSTFTSDNFVDWLNRGAIKNTTKFCKILAKSAEIDYKYEIANRIPITELSQSERDHIIETCDGIIANDPNQYAAKLIGKASNFLTASKSIEEFAERVGTYMQLTAVAEETSTFLTLLKDNTDDELLIKAIDSVLAITSDSFTGFFDAVIEDASISIGKYAIKQIFEGKWKNFLITTLTAGKLSTGAVLIDGALLAVNIGQTVSNIAFNTNKKLEHYELTKAFVVTEKAIKDTVDSLLSSYDQTSQAGFILSSGIELLYRAYDLDSELCLDLVSIMDKDWIKLSTTEESNEAKNDINFVRNFYSEQYKNIIPAEGACGNTLYWIFNKLTNELLVYGYGEMFDYERDNAPWNEFCGQIESLHISPYCNKVGSNAFCNLSNLKSPLILKDDIDGIVSYGSGCFDMINPESCIIFTNESDVVSLNETCPVYALSSLNIKGGSSSFKEFYIDGTLSATGILTITQNGKLSAMELNAYSCFLSAEKNSNLSIYGYAKIEGPDSHFESPSSYVKVYCDAMKLYDGAALNVYGDARFCSGKFYQYSGSNIYVAGDCIIPGGNIAQGTYYYLYGDMVVEKKLTIQCGYCRDSYLYVYGTVTAADSEQIYHPSESRGDIYIYGSMYIVDDTVKHNLKHLYVHDENAYLSVHGDAELIKFTTSDDACVGTMELYDNVHFEKSGTEKLTLLFSGEKEQTVSGVYYSGNIAAGTIILNNPNGVNFVSPVTSYRLFNHNQKPFSLSTGTNTFQDYDGDGLKDNEDPYPLDPLNGQNDTKFNVKLKESKITITGYNGDEKDLIIPDTICGYEVTGIDNLCNNNIEKIFIGANVSNINTEALDELTELKEISAANDNKYYTSLNGILYDNQLSKLIRCPINYSDENVIVAESVTDISPYAFYNCAIKNVLLPEKIQTIGSFAFSGCLNIKSINLNHVQKIDTRAFYNSGLIEVTIPEETNSIGRQAFSNCSKLTKVYYNAIDCKIVSTFLKYSPFPKTITNFIIGENVKYLDNYLLKNCTIDEIYIPKSVENINSNSFYNCNGLTIKAYVNSCASEFAKKNNYSFIAVTCENCVFGDWQISIYPTCTEYGEMIGVCKVCGNINKAVVEKKEHVDENDDGICDNCNSRISSNNKKCSHICHKSGIAGFVWKILNFFYRLFGINERCECGAMH